MDIGATKPMTNIELTDDEAKILHSLLSSMTIPMTLAQSRVLSDVDDKLAAATWTHDEREAFRDNVAVPTKDINHGL